MGGNTVSVLDTGTNAVISTINVGTFPQWVANTPDGSRAYVSNSGDNTLSVISTGTNTVTGIVSVGPTPTQIAISPNGSRAYVTNSGDNTVSVIDTATDALVTDVPVGHTPQGVVATGSGNEYVTDTSDSTVSVVDTTSNTVTGTISVGNHPYGIAVATVPTYAAQVQQPINPDASSVFSATRGVVPVKFTLSLNGNPTCSLPPANISVSRTLGSSIGPIDESVYQMSADAGSSFRIDSANCQYIYNLASKSLGPGTYKVQISINSVAVGSATFGLQ